MGKKGGSKLLRSHAHAIARKLKAELTSGKAHITAAIRYKGVLVAHFGIRHGAKSKHGHLPSQLFISQSQAAALAACNISTDQYFEMLKNKGKLPAQ